VYEGRVNRLDVSEIGKPTRTPQGFLRVPATPTRAGIFIYRRADGTTRRELRPEAEVFNADSLSSLSGAPLTDLHPREMVSPKNVRTLAIGHVGDSVRRDGQRVAAEITVEDDAAISAVERRDRVELSCGYACELDETPGTHEGQRYDAVQRKIRYNHVALLPRGAGRGGPELALRLDARDAVGVMREGDQSMDLVTIKVGGRDVQVTKEAAAAIESHNAEQLRQRVKLAFGDKPKLDGTHSSTQAIKIAVIEHHKPSLALAGKSEEYIDGTFDALIDQQERERGLRRDAKHVQIDRAAKPFVPAWSQPLSVSRDSADTRRDSAQRLDAITDWQKPLSVTNI
jgi:hypothetical protein